MVAAGSSYDQSLMHHGCDTLFGKHLFPDQDKPDFYKNNAYE
jgi:hypothetical protein